jgi:hypothetical protein
MYVKITCVPSSALINAMLPHTARTVSSAAEFAESQAASSRPAALSWISFSNEKYE